MCDKKRTLGHSYALSCLECPFYQSQIVFIFVMVCAIMHAAAFAALDPGAALSPALPALYVSYDI